MFGCSGLFLKPKRNRGQEAGEQAHRGSVSRAMWSAWLTAVKRFTSFPPPPPPAAPSLLSASPAAAALPPDMRRSPVTAAALLAASLSALAVAIDRLRLLREAGDRTAELGSHRRRRLEEFLVKLCCSALLLHSNSLALGLGATWADKHAVTTRDYPRVRAISPLLYAPIFLYCN